MEREHINPTGVYKHPAFTRVVTVKGPMKIIFIAGQTPSDENYQCRIFVLDVDEFLKVASDPNAPRYGDPDRPPPSTMVGVTRLSHPDFLIEIDLTAIVEA